MSTKARKTVPSESSALSKAETPLRFSAEEFKSFAEGASHAIFIFQDQKVIYVNPACERISGYSRDELLSMNFWQIVHPDFLQMSQQRAQARMRGEKVLQRYEVAFLTKQGETRWADFTATLIQYGGQPAIIGTAYDISDRVRRERELKAIADIADATRSCDSRRQLIPAIMEQVQTLLSADGITLALLNERGEIVHEHSCGLWKSVEGLRVPPGSGITEIVIQTGEPYINLEELGSETRICRPDLLSGLTSGVCVPLSVPGQTIGALWVGRREPLTIDELSVIGAISDIVASSIHRATLHEQAERTAREFSMLYESTKGLSHHQDLQTLLRTTAEWSRTMLRAAGAGIALFDSARGELSATVTLGKEDGSFHERLRLGEGLAGQVAKTHEPLIIEDFRVWPDRMDTSQGVELTSVIMVPMLYQGELIGTLGVHEFAPTLRKFTEDDQRLLTLLASQASSAVHATRLYEETRRRLREMEAINEISSAMRVAQTLEELLNLLLDKILKILDTSDGSIVQFDPDNREFTIRVSRGWFDRLKEMAPEMRLGLSGHVLATGDSYVVKDFATDPLINEKRRHIMPASYAGVCLPLRAAEQVVGILYLAVAHPRTLSHEELLLLSTLTEIAGSVIHRMVLFEQARYLASELAVAYDATLEGWVRALEMRDHETEGHTQRVTELTLSLARAMDFPDEDLEHVRRGALLHDIGKIAVSDTILQKPSSLSEGEWRVMRKHPTHAYDMLSPINYLMPSLDIPFCHHERWDGRGYPRGLEGDKIPLSARIFSVVDAYDAMTTDRPYRKAMGHQQAIEEIKRGAGTQFDPKVVEAFLRVIPKINGTR